MATCLNKRSQIALQQRTNARLHTLSHAGQNYWMLIGWDRGHFFLNHEGTFGNQEGMITWCWLAEHACIKLVSLFKRILKRNFINASLLSLILTRLFHLNVKENPHATKRSLLVEKQRIFPTINALIRSLKKVWVGTACVARSIELQNFMATKLKANFFVSLRVALLVLQVALSA